MNEYKIEQLKLMLAAEQNKEDGGYGAHLSHWSGRAKDVQLDEKALQALIDHYMARTEQDK